MNLVTIKVSLEDEKYINWKNNKTVKTKQPIENENKIAESAMPSKLPNLKNNDEPYVQDSRKLFRPETMSEGLLQLHQPFGSAKTYSVIDQMYFDKYDNITTKKCNWCTLSFTHYPTVIPYNVQRRNARIQQISNAPSKQILKEDSYVCKGCYCSFNCAMAQICESTDTDKARQKELLYALYRLSGHSPDETIVPSPSKELMIDYGGILTEDDFKTLIGAKNRFQMTYPHIICIGARISRVKIYAQ